MPTRESESLLARWLRRKAEARDGGGKAPAATAAQQDVAPPSTAAVQDLPEIDSLHTGSDFSIFMAPGVPDAVRNRALRKLWSLDPALANLDGMLDYDEVLPQAGTALAAVRTGYDVATGAMASDRPDGARKVAEADRDDADRGKDRGFQEEMS